MQTNPLVDMVAIAIHALHIQPISVLLLACSSFIYEDEWNPSHTRKQTVDEDPYLVAQHRWPIVGV